MNVLTFILLAAAAVKAALLGSGDGLTAAGTAVSKARLPPLLAGLDSCAAPAAFLAKGFLGWRRWLVMAGRGTSSSRLARAATSGLPGRSSASWEASNMSCD